MVQIKNMNDQKKIKKDKESTSTETKKKQILDTSTGVTRIVSEEDTLIMDMESRKDSPPTLLLLSGPKDLIGLSWPLKNPVTNIGRSSRLNDITVMHNNLSKSHFQIIKEEENFYIVDLRSTNKTYVNDDELEPYQKIPLKNNSYIRASQLIFKFLTKGSIEVFSSQQMLDKAQTDPLTGAGNRQLLRIKGPEYFFSGKNLSLIVFDIDDFKYINDNFGHRAGDHVLKELSKYVLDVIREGDLFIRYGGDEFCIFTPNKKSIAEDISERIRKKIQDNKCSFKGQKIPFDISIGLAEKQAGDKVWEDIYHRADENSYEKKREKKSLKK